GDGQPNTQSAETARRVRFDLVELLEDFAQLVGRDTDAVILDIHLDVTAALDGANRDLAAAGCKANGVVDNVDEGRGQLVWVGSDEQGLRWHVEADSMMHLLRDLAHFFEGGIQDLLHGHNARFKGQTFGLEQV